MSLNSSFSSAGNVLLKLNINYRIMGGGHYYLLLVSRGKVFCKLLLMYVSSNTLFSRSCYCWKQEIEIIFCSQKILLLVSKKFLIKLRKSHTFTSKQQTFDKKIKKFMCWQTWTLIHFSSVLLTLFPQRTVSVISCVRDFECNFKWPFMQRWQWPIYNVTLESFVRSSMN